MCELALRAQRLCKVFPRTKKTEEILALGGVSLQVGRGEIVALIGPDGAGKTTFMRLACGLLRPTDGELYLGDTPVAEHPQEVQSRVSYMPQKFGLYEELTIQENLDLYASLRGVKKELREKRFAKLLDMTGLASFTGRQAGRLSGGMKQKLGLACTLVQVPELLILDEPTVGVDPLSRRELWAILKDIVEEESLSVLVSTAYLDEAARCDRVYILDRGKLLASGTPEELQAMAEGCTYVASPPEGVPLRILQASLLEEQAVLDAVPSCSQVRYTVAPGTGAAEASHLPSLVHFGVAGKPCSPRLEDSFMLLLKEAQKERGGEDLPAPDEGKAAGKWPVAVPQRKEDDLPVDIEVQDLVKSFGDFTAVSHISFSVHRGEVFGLLGPNGAGKTTTFRMLCGLLPATEGRLQVAGVDLRTARREARANIGYVAQKFSLYENLTVRENLLFYGGVYGLSGRRLRERFQAVIEEFSLTEVLDTLAGKLPGGYRQRLSMAAALIHEPQILFLDEPTSGIDPLARRIFWQQITRLAARGTTIIITTHFMDEAEYCDRFLIQDQGKLRALGSPRAIRTRLGMPQADMDEVFLQVVEEGRGEAAL